MAGERLRRLAKYTVLVINRVIYLPAGAPETLRCLISKSGHAAVGNLGLFTRDAAQNRNYFPKLGFASRFADACDQVGSETHGGI
jgi:hypothetical protein